VADVSGTLRAARERAGLSLEELSARTRIKLAFLAAIEDARFEALPGEFFTRAFLRTCARELHLPPDEIVAAFDASRVPEPEPAGDRPMPPAEPRIEKGSLRETPWLLSASGMMPVALTALVLIAAIYMWARPAAPDVPVEPGATGTTGVARTPPVPVRAGVPTPPVPEVEPEFLVVEIATTGSTWITATADGQRAAYRLFEAGDRLTIRAREELSFRLGNAGAFEYAINGTTGRPVGGPGDVREFRITRANFRDFLAIPDR
jgi:cytoskeletal protein RodZ